jgi:hypothetical protein
MKANPSIVVNSQVPEFIRSDYAKFITFLQKYYQYLESSGNALDVIRNLDTFNDIDEQTDQEILSVFYSLFLPDFPQVVSVDKRFVLKNIAEFYNSKGSIDSIKAFFRIIYGEEVQVYLPKVDILKLDAGIWNKVFKIKIHNLSAGEIKQLNGSEVYQVDPINGNKTVKARVVDYTPETGTLFLSADNVVLNFNNAYPVYATNSEGNAVTFYLETQLASASVTTTGQNYSAGEAAIALATDTNGENIVIDGIKNGVITDIKVLDGGKDYSIYDTISFGTGRAGEIPATARIAITDNDELTSETDAFQWLEPEDRLTYDDGFDIRQEMGVFGNEISSPNIKLSDESTTNMNSGSISSGEFGIASENQTNDTITYSRASYTYNQGLFRPIVPRVGAVSNYSINYARGENVSVLLNDEELWIGSIACEEGTPANPGTVIIQFDTDEDYNNMTGYELTDRTSNKATAPTVGVVNTKSSDERVLDSKIGGLSLQQQIGMYDYGQQTLSPLYPFCENNASTSTTGPAIYIRESSQLCGHDLNSSRPWEYRFKFKKNSTVKAKIYIMPVQYDLRSTKILGEDGVDIIAESDDTNVLIQEVYDGTINRVEFDPTTVFANTITAPAHGFSEGEIIRFEEPTYSPDLTPFQLPQYKVGGLSDQKLYFCHVVNEDQFKLMPYSNNSEALNYGLFESLTPAGYPDYPGHFHSFVGAHVTNGADYTSSDVQQSAISINAKKITIGARDPSLDYNVDPLIPVDADTGLKTSYPYTVDNKIYLFQSILEETDYIKMERDVYAASEEVTLALETDTSSANEQEEYITHPFLALENSSVTTIQNNNDIEIPDFASVRVMVERKSLQSVDDINRGSQRLIKAWNDYADISTAQELFNIAEPKYYDEYDGVPYVNGVFPEGTSDFVSGPAEFANMGSTMFVASSKNNSVYYTDGSGLGNYIYAAEFNDQRRVSFVETNYYDGVSSYKTAQNGPLGVTFASSGAYNTNSKRYFTINFSLPQEMNNGLDMPFEVNLTNIIKSSNIGSSYYETELNEVITMEGAPFPGSDVFMFEDGATSVGAEVNVFGYNSFARGKLSTMTPTIVIDFFSPSLPESNPKKHMVFYCNKAEYTDVSSDVTKTIYSFFNCWSPAFGLVPDTTVRDYTISIRSVQKSDYIIEKLSDTQLLASDPATSSVNNIYTSPFVKEAFVRTYQNEYGKYIKLYPTYADAVAQTNSLVPFSMGSDFGSNLPGNEMFYNPITSGTTVTSAYSNPLSSANNKMPFLGAVKDTNLSLARYFDPQTDVGVDTITINNHGFVDGSWARFRADFSGMGPDGLVDNTSYYIKSVDANTIKLAASKPDYDSNTFVSFTAHTMPEMTCALQTIPQSLSYSSVKELSFDIKKYIDKLDIINVDLPNSVITTDGAHTLSSFNTFVYINDDQPIGGLISNKTYYALYVSNDQLRVCNTKEDAVNGNFIVFDSVGSGASKISVKGNNGNMLPQFGSHMEQEFFTAGQYYNILHNGDQVTVYNQRKISPDIDSGQLVYVRSSETDTSESFSLTINSDLTTSNFGFADVLSSNVNLTTNSVYHADQFFYTGEQLNYTAVDPITTAGATPLPTVVYAIRVDGDNFKLAASFEDAIAGDALDLVTQGTGVHYFNRTNLDTASEIAEVIPYSSQPNYAAVFNPSVTGTGYEEFTISYGLTLETETGAIDTIQVTSQGSYKHIPETMVITTDGRTGTGADIYPLTRDIGALRSLEILDGGIHQTSTQLYLPYSFLSETIVGDFIDGEDMLVGSVVIGSLISKTGHYFKVSKNAANSYALAANDVVTGASSGATATVTKNLTASAVAAPASITTSTESGSTNNYSGDKGLLNTSSKLQDSSYYQDYSYVIRGANSHDDWKPYFNKLVHPAGMAVFGEVDYFTESIANQKLGNTTVVGTSINNTNTAITTEMTT